MSLSGFVRNSVRGLNAMRGLGQLYPLSTEVKFAGRYIPKDAIIFDIGANKGTYTQEVFKRYSDRIAALYAFEPGHASFEELKKNTKDLKNLKVFNLGLSDTKEKKTLYYDRADSALASLHHRRLDHFAIDFNGSETIDLTTFDDFVSENKIERIDFAKFDIEGHEMTAFKGAIKSFESQKIHALQFEFGGCNIDSKTFFQDFFYFLKGLNYKIIRLAPLGLHTVIDKYTEDLEFFSTTNYFAERK